MLSPPVPPGHKFENWHKEDSKPSNFIHVLYVAQYADWAIIEEKITDSTS